MSSITVHVGKRGYDELTNLTLFLGSEINGVLERQYDEPPVDIKVCSHNAWDRQEVDLRIVIDVMVSHPEDLYPRLSSSDLKIGNLYGRLERHLIQGTTFKCDLRYHVGRSAQGEGSRT